MSQASRQPRTLEGLAELGAGLNPGRAVGSNFYRGARGLPWPSAVSSGRPHGSVGALAGQGGSC